MFTNILYNSLFNLLFSLVNSFSLLSGCIFARTSFCSIDAEDLNFANAGDEWDEETKDILDSEEDEADYEISTFYQLKFFFVDYKFKLPMKIFKIDILEFFS
jgi:hypothetical protein